MGKSRATIALVVCFLSFVAPALPCLAIALAPVRSSLELALVGGAALGWLALLVLTSWWEFTGLWLRWAWAAAFGASLLVRVAARPPPEAWAAPDAWAAPGTAGIAAAALLAGGWATPGGPSGPTFTCRPCARRAAIPGTVRRSRCGSAGASS